MAAEKQPAIFLYLNSERNNANLCIFWALRDLRVRNDQNLARNKKLKIKFAREVVRSARTTSEASASAAQLYPPSPSTPTGANPIHERALSRPFVRRTALARCRRLQSARRARRCARSPLQISRSAIRAPSSSPAWTCRCRRRPRRSLRWTRTTASRCGRPPARKPRTRSRP